MEKENLKKEAVQFLNENVMAVLSTVSESGIPQVSTMYFYSDDNFNFYFITAINSKKLNNILSNKNVAVAVGFGPAPITIQAGGIAEISHEYKDEFMSKVMEKINYHNLYQWPVLLLEKEGLAIIKVIPSWLTLLNFDRDGHPNTYSSDFHSILP